jgi:hypothetical protein
MILLTILFASMLSGKPTPMYEPVFSADFDTAAVHFEPVPTKLYAPCRLPSKMAWWIFAHTQSENMDIYILSGFRRFVPDGPSKKPGPVEPDIGIVARVKSGKCSVIDIDNGLSLDGGPDPDHKVRVLTPEQRKSLGEDLAARYMKAFGSRRALFQALKEDSLGNEIRPKEFGEALHALSAQ